jgi:hypothetical protein
VNRFDELLDAFAHTFYGYGNYKGAYWFIGMEEGGGSFEDVVTRLSVWDHHGRLELEDVALFHNEIGYGYYFEKRPKRPKLQQTWNKLIRILLSAEGKLLSEKRDEARKELVREYQRTLLGRAHGQSCLIELLPLPSRSTKPKDWIYAEHSALDYCADREVYKAHFMPLRANHKERIAQYTPQVVVFYGVEYLYWWEQIADTPFFCDKTYGIRIAPRESTLFVIANHPVTPGITNAYFHDIGQMIAYERAQLLDSGKL